MPRTMRLPLFKLEHIFDEEEINELVRRARRHVFREFDHAVMPGRTRRDKQRGTDNQYFGAGGTLAELRKHMMRAISHRKRGFLRLRDLPRRLPDELVQLSNREFDYLLLEVQSQALELALRSLHESRDRDLYFMASEGGYWAVSQGAVDAWRTETQEIKRVNPYNPTGTKKKKRANARGYTDKRNWHGKPREQARSRGISEGAPNSVRAR